MRHVPLILLALVTCACAVTHDNGVVRVPSAHDVATTADKLEASLDSKGMTVFTRIDHAKGARAAGLELGPTQLIVFGNPMAGTPLMQCRRTAGIDLPQKVLIYEEQDGRVWLAYNDPGYLKRRHSIEGCDDVLDKISEALATFSRAATAN